jgi:hypothetical protein
MVSIDAKRDAQLVIPGTNDTYPLITSELWGSEFASPMASAANSSFGSDYDPTISFGNSPKFCKPSAYMTSVVTGLANPATAIKPQDNASDVIFSTKAEKRKEAKRLHNKRQRDRKAALKKASKKLLSKSSKGSSESNPKEVIFVKQSKKQRKAGGKAVPQVPKGSLTGNAVSKSARASVAQNDKSSGVKSKGAKDSKSPQGKEHTKSASDKTTGSTTKSVGFEQMRIDLSRLNCGGRQQDGKYLSNYRLTEEEYNYAITVLPDVVPGTTPHDHALAATVRGYCQQVCESYAKEFGKIKSGEPRIADFFGCKRIDHESKHIFMPNISTRDAGRHKPALASWCECVDYSTCVHSGSLDAGICIDAIYCLNWEIVEAMCEAVSSKTIFIAYHPMDSKEGSSLCGTYTWKTEDDMVSVECGTGDLKEVYDHPHPSWFSSWMGKRHSASNGKVLNISHRRAVGPMRIAMVQLTAGRADTYVGKPSQMVHKVVGRNAFYNNLYSIEGQCIDGARHPFCDQHDSEVYETAIIAASMHAESVLSTRSIKPELCPHGVVFSEKFTRYTNKDCTQLLAMPSSSFTIEDGRPGDYNIVHITLDMTQSLELYFKRECVYFNGRIAVFGPQVADLEVEQVERNLSIEHNGPLVRCTLTDRVTHFGWATISKPYIRILSGELLRDIAVDAITHTHSKETTDISKRLIGSVRRIIKKSHLSQDLLAIDAELYMRLGLIRVMTQSSRAFRSTERNLPKGQDFSLLGNATYEKTFYQKCKDFGSDLKGSMCIFSCKSQRHCDDDPLVLPYGSDVKPFYNLDGRCAKNIILAKIDDGASLTERDSGPCCEVLSKDVAVVYGPIISPSILTVPIGCTHDCQAALTNRQLRDPGLPVDKRSFKKVYDLIMEDEVFFALFGADKAAPIQPLTFDELEATSTWGLGVRKDRRAAWEDWQTMSETEANSKLVLQRKAFCKLEISVKTSAMLDEDPAAPRCVSGGTDYYQSVLGRFSKAAANHVKVGSLSGSRDGVPTIFAYGMQKPSVLSEILDSYDEMEEFAEADYSKFDAHQMEELLSFEIDVYERMFGDNMTQRELNLLRTQLSTTGLFVGRRSGSEQAIWDYVHAGKRRSGDPNTSIGNSIVNIFCLIHWLLQSYSVITVRDWILVSSPIHFLVGGDDVAIAGTTAVMTNLASTVKSLSKVGMRLDFVPRNCLADMTFFQRNYYRMRDGTLRALPKPGRILAKTFASTTKPTSIEDANTAIYVLSKNFARDYAGFPVMGPLFSRLACITEPKVGRKRGSQLLLEHSKLVEMGVLETDHSQCTVGPSLGAILHFKEKYQLNDADIGRLENAIKLINKPQVFLDHPLWHKFLIGDEVLAETECCGPFGHDAWQ